MNPSSTSFVLGYHGCSRDVAEKIISGRQSLLPSQNNYDWLGDGIYFWEFNAQRAYEFALELRARSGRHKKSYQPAVIGAIIDLGFCLNLLDSRYIELVRQAHDDLAHQSNQADTELPSNSLGPDRLLRRLDCAVIRHLHWLQGHEGKQPFDTVRAAFFEGDVSTRMPALPRKITSRFAFAIRCASKVISAHSGMMVGRSVSNEVRWQQIAMSPL